MEFYEKFPKPKIPLSGFHTDLFIERLVKSYEILGKAAEKTSKDVDKVQEEFSKFSSYAKKSETVGATQ